MNKISLYVLLILIYLGISKSFSPSEKKTLYLANEKYYASLFRGAPISVVLKEYFSAGFLIKTYYHRYIIIHAFKSPEEIVIRTSKEFWEQNLRNKGMSLFRRGEREFKTSSIPMPPGSLFIGDPAYGTWDITKYGAKVWKFHRTYKNFPTLFGWGEFRPTLDFYQRMKIFQSDSKPYYGPESEFGTDGSITDLEEEQELEDEHNLKEESIVDTLKSYFRIPKWEQKLDE